MHGCIVIGLMRASGMVGGLEEEGSCGDADVKGSSAVMALKNEAASDRMEQAELGHVS